MTETETRAFVRGAVTALIADGLSVELERVLEPGDPRPDAEAERAAASAWRSLPESDRTELRRAASALVAEGATVTRERLLEFRTSLVAKLFQERRAGRTDRADLVPGDRFAGRYVIGEALGRGGFGTVYRAKHEELGEEVALKVLHPDRAETEQGRERFLREVKATKSFVHKYAVQLRDFGRDEERGALYFTMDLVEGPTLARLLESERTLPEARVLALAVQVLDVLEAAHEAGIVHRDLKPGNLILTRNRRDEEEVRVLDFGLARAISSLRDDLSDITQPGAVCGTVAYMSPEQAAGKPLDGRSDLYALGVVLYEALAGKKPLDPADTLASGATAVAFLTRLQLEEPRDLASVTPTVSRGVARAIMRALSKKPEARFESSRAFRLALGGASATTIVDAPRLEPGRRRPWTAFVAASLVAALAVAAVALRSLPIRPAEPPSGPPPPPATLSFVELDPSDGKVAYRSRPELHVAGKLSDATSGPVHIEAGARTVEARVDGAGRFSAVVPFEAPATLVRVVAGRPPREVSASIPVVVDAVAPVVTVLAIEPGSPTLCPWVRRHDGRVLRDLQPVKEPPLDLLAGGAAVGWRSARIRGVVHDQNPPSVVSIAVDAAGFHRAYEAALDARGAFEAKEVELPARDGEAKILVTARDLAGNEGSTRVELRTTGRPAELTADGPRALEATTPSAHLVVRATKPLIGLWANDVALVESNGTWAIDVPVPAGGVRSISIWGEDGAQDPRLGPKEPALGRVEVRRAGTESALSRGRELAAKAVDWIGGAAALGAITRVREKEETSATHERPARSTFAVGEQVCARVGKDLWDETKDRWDLGVVTGRDQGTLLLKALPGYMGKHRASEAVPLSRRSELYEGCPIWGNYRQGSTSAGEAGFVLARHGDDVIGKFRKWAFSEPLVGPVAEAKGPTVISRSFETIVELPDRLHWIDDLRVRPENGFPERYERRVELWTVGSTSALEDGRFGSEREWALFGGLADVATDDEADPSQRLRSHGSTRARFFARRVAFRGIAGLIRVLREAARGRVAACVDGDEDVGGRKFTRLALTPEGADRTLVLFVDPETGAIVGRRDGLSGGDDDTQTLLYDDWRTVSGIKVPLAWTIAGDPETRIASTVEIDPEIDPKSFALPPR